MFPSSYIDTVKILYERLALHEAGHAAMCVLLKKKFLYVTIEPEGKLKEKYKGFVEGVEPISDTMENLLINAAGYYSEKIFVGNAPCSQDVASEDFSRISYTITQVYGYGSHRAQEVHQLLAEKCTAMLKEHWHLVTKLAKELQKRKTIYFNDVLRILNENN